MNDNIEDYNVDVKPSMDTKLLLIELNQLNDVLVKCEKHLTFFTKLGWGGVFVLILDLLVN